MREVLRNFAYKALVVVGALTLCAGLVTAATSIGTNIQTDGMFAAVGTSTFSGRVGISTTTPGSLFSVGVITNFTVATSTFYSTGGINLTGGCFAVNGTCLGGGSSGGSSDILTATVALSADQLNHMHSSPIELVAAPGVGKVALPFEAIVIYSKGSHGYYTGPNADHPQIAVGSTYLYNASLLNIDSLTSSMSRVIFSAVLDNSIHNIDLASLENQRISLGNSLFDLIDHGEVTASTLISGGSGYQVGDRGGFNENNTAGMYTVTAVDGGGAVTSYTLDTGDTVVNGATVGQTLTTWVATGAGDGNFRIRVDAIAPGNGTASVTVMYQVIDLP